MGRPRKKPLEGEEPQAPARRTTALTEEQVRDIAREEIASLAGLMLGRLGERGWNLRFIQQEMAEVWGEALSDFSGQSGTGNAPGKD